MTPSPSPAATRSNDQPIARPRLAEAASTVAARSPRDLGEANHQPGSEGAEKKAGVVPELGWTQRAVGASKKMDTESYDKS